MKVTSSVLLTCHDAGGTVPPMLALAEALVRSGQEVRFLSQPSVRQRAEAAGCTFTAFTTLADYRSRVSIEEQIDLSLPAVSGKDVGDDLIAAARQHEIDLLVVDANLAGVLAAAETLDAPCAVLLHSMYATFVDTWFADLWPFLDAPINETRAAYGLPARDGWPAVFGAHDRLIAVVPRDFDAPVADVPETLRHFGFLVPATPPTERHVSFPSGDAPTVLVGLSTTFQHQGVLLEAIIEALGGLNVRALVTTAGQVDVDMASLPPNVAATAFVPHGVVLPQTDVMVTHAGLGSVATALTFGVPLVCAPISRDQPLNADRVAKLGAGIALTETPTAASIATAIEQVLANSAYRESARAQASASKRQGGAAAAAADLLALRG